MIRPRRRPRRLGPPSRVFNARHGQVPHSQPCGSLSLACRGLGSLSHVCRTVYSRCPCVVCLLESTKRLDRLSLCTLLNIAIWSILLFALDISHVEILALQFSAYSVISQGRSQREGSYCTPSTTSANGARIEKLQAQWTPISAAALPSWVLRNSLVDHGTFIIQPAIARSKNLFHSKAVPPLMSRL